MTPCKGCTTKAACKKAKKCKGKAKKGATRAKKVSAKKGY